MMPVNQDPFSAIAGTYDRDFSSLPGVAPLRDRMLSAALGAFPRGGRVLDLGCGTGEDAVRLARAGYRVTACDTSDAMLARAGERARTAGVPLTVRHLDAGNLGGLPDSSFDALYSNFGALNLLESPAVFFEQCHRILSPAGALLICLFGRYSPWEILTSLLRGNPARAVRRLRQGAVDVPVGNATVPVRYFSSSRIIAEARPRFLLVRSWGLNVISPPPSSAGIAGKLPRLAAGLWNLEARVAGLYPLSRAGDHVAFLFRRSP